MLRKWKKLIMSSSTFEITPKRSIFICYWAILYGLGLYTCHIRAFTTKAHWLLLVHLSLPATLLSINFSHSEFAFRIVLKLYSDLVDNNKSTTIEIRSHTESTKTAKGQFRIHSYHKFYDIHNFKD